MNNSQKFPKEWEAFQRCGASKFISIEEQFDPHLAQMGRYSQLLKTRNKQIIIDPETSDFTSNQKRHRPTPIPQNTNLEIVDTLMNVGIDKTPRGQQKPSDHTPIWIEIEK